MTAKTAGSSGATGGVKEGRVKVNPQPVRLDPEEDLGVRELAGRTGMPLGEILRRCVRFALPKFQSGEVDLLKYGAPEDK